MRLVVTGAAGTVGWAVVAAALADPDIGALTVTDRALSGLPPDPRLRAVPGDIADPAVQAAVWDGTDALIHLAAVLGGAAEDDPATSRRVNLDATLDLMDRAAGRRFVLASSIAVWGPPPARTTDDTPAAPRLIYALHKHMAECALGALTRRGALDGVALRLPGVVARPDDGAGLKSAFLSAMFHAARARRPITLPVASEGRTWLASVPAVGAGLVHAATLPTNRLRARRTLALPALAPRFAELATAPRPNGSPNAQSRLVSAPSANWRPRKPPAWAFLPTRTWMRWLRGRWPRTGPERATRPRR